MHGRTGDRDLMEPPEIVRDPAGTEVILLAQIQDLAYDLGWRPRAVIGVVRGAIAEPCIAVGPMSMRPFVVGLTRDTKVPAGLRHRPVLRRGVLQNL